ncbi:MAG: hypothetical protein JWM68_2732 [Verrucomicrobiales bacterium]|nr:hypothetical protein [Verrucomicrobiales bacterium]
MKKLTILFLAFASLLPAVIYAIGEAGGTEWPQGATVAVELRVAATIGTNDQVKVSGDVLITNQGSQPLTIQSPHNRLVLAFLVLDPLGNAVPPKGLAKVDPGFETHIVPARSTYTHHFESLDFLTGSALFGYDLSPGTSYRVIAVYRPAGPQGPGFTSQETNLEIPPKNKQQ